MIDCVRCHGAFAARARRSGRWVCGLLLGAGLLGGAAQGQVEEYARGILLVKSSPVQQEEFVARAIPFTRVVDFGVVVHVHTGRGEPNVVQKNVIAWRQDFPDLFYGDLVGDIGRAKIDVICLGLEQLEDRFREAAAAIRPFRQVAEEYRDRLAGEVVRFRGQWVTEERYAEVVARESNMVRQAAERELAARQASEREREDLARREANLARGAETLGGKELLKEFGKVSRLIGGTGVQSAPILRPIDRAVFREALDLPNDGDTEFRLYESGKGAGGLAVLEAVRDGKQVGFLACAAVGQTDGGGFDPQELELLHRVIQVSCAGASEWFALGLVSARTQLKFGGGQGEGYVTRELDAMRVELSIAAPKRQPDGTVRSMVMLTIW